MPESEKEKTDRQLTELLNELRVALPGAQVLLAFLLTAPFATRFGRASRLDHALLFAGTVVTGVGVLLLLAPSVYHRMRWAEGGKEDVIRVGHRLFLAGTACLAVGLCLGTFVVGDFLYGGLAAGLATALLAVVVLVTWYALPLRRGRDPRVRRHE